MKRKMTMRADENLLKAAGMDEQIVIRLHGELKETLGEQAERFGGTKSAVVRAVLRGFVKMSREEQTRHIMRGVEG